MSGYKHFPAYDRLCDYAKAAGLQVRLPVSTGITQFSAPRGEEYKMFKRLELWIDDTAPAIAEEIHNDDLETAALNLLSRAR